VEHCANASLPAPCHSPHRHPHTPCICTQRTAYTRVWGAATSHARRDTPRRCCTRPATQPTLASAVAAPAAHPRHQHTGAARGGSSPQQQCQRRRPRRDPQTLLPCGLSLRSTHRVRGCWRALPCLNAACAHRVLCLCVCTSGGRRSLQAKHTRHSTHTHTHTHTHTPGEWEGVTTTFAPDGTPKLLPGACVCVCERANDSTATRACLVPC
jgi:hypothetical protein